MASRENSSWQNGAIFSQFKLFLAVSPRGPRGPTYKILFAQDNFFAVLGYTRDHLPMVLQDLYSNANELATISELDMRILSGAHHSTHLNLVDARGNNLSCYVQVMAGGCARLQDPSDPSRVVVDRFTTMTVNSASRIGNANLLRLMVTDPVAQRRLLNERVGVPESVPVAVEAPVPRSFPLRRSSYDSSSNTSTESMVSSDLDEVPVPVSATARAATVSVAITSVSAALQTTAVLPCTDELDLQEAAGLTEKSASGLPEAPLAALAVAAPGPEAP